MTSTDPVVPAVPDRAPALRTAALRTAREQPQRPSLATSNLPPVVDHVPPPLSVRASELFWVLALAVGAVAIVYLFIVRPEQVEVLTERVRAIAPDRPEGTLTTAADIVYWVLFGTLLAVVLLQLLFLVSFANRRPRARWWMFGSLLVLGLVLAFGVEFTQVASPLASLPLILLVQAGLGILALLMSVLPAAIRWTARGVDVRRGPTSTDAGGEF